MKKLIAATGLALVFGLLIAAPASAASFAATDAVPAVVFTLNPSIVIQIVLAVILPILVGLVTTRVTSSAAKAWLLAGLTAVTSLTVELGRSVATGSTYDLGLAILAVFPAFAISVAMHYGLWKPTGTAERMQGIGNTAP